MAQLSLEVTVELRLTGPELTLIRAALSGRIRPDQLADAKALDTVLAEQLVRVDRHRSQEITKLARNLGID